MYYIYKYNTKTNVNLYYIYLQDYIIIPQAALICVTCVSSVNEQQLFQMNAFDQMAWTFTQTDFWL